MNHVSEDTCCDRYELNNDDGEESSGEREKDKKDSDLSLISIVVF